MRRRREEDVDVKEHILSDWLMADGWWLIADCWLQVIFGLNIPSDKVSHLCPDKGAFVQHRRIWLNLLHNVATQLNGIPFSYRPIGRSGRSGGSRGSYLITSSCFRDTTDPLSWKSTCQRFTPQEPTWIRSWMPSKSSLPWRLALPQKYVDDTT